MSTHIRSYVGRHHVALLALFVALGGTSYAAINLPANSVGPKQIKRSAVTSAKVKDASLLARDFKPGELAGPVQVGPAGAAGAQGAHGVNGGDGANGLEGPTGPTGLRGPAGEDATVAAHALVDQGGGFYDGFSKNIDLVARAATGYYCLRSSFNHIMVGTIHGQTPGAIAVYPVTNINCAGSTDSPYNIAVQTWDSAGAPADRTFYLVVYN